MTLPEEPGDFESLGHRLDLPYRTDIFEEAVALFESTEVKHGLEEPVHKWILKLGIRHSAHAPLGPENSATALGSPLAGGFLPPSKNILIK